MNKKTAFLAALTMLLIVIATGCSKSHFFGNVDMGMTRDEVKQAQSAFGEPSTILDDESYLYRETVYLNAGGDAVYRFDASGRLNGIIFYAYQQYYTDEIYAAFLEELKAVHKGYAQVQQTATDILLESWTIEGTAIKVTLEYKKDQYMVLRYQTVE